MGSQHSRPAKKQGHSSSRGHRELPSSRSNAVRHHASPEARSGSRRAQMLEEQRRAEAANEAQWMGSGPSGRCGRSGRSGRNGHADHVRPGAVSRLGHVQGMEPLEPLEPLVPPPGFDQTQRRQEEHALQHEATAAFSYQREAAAAFAEFDSVAPWLENSQCQGNVDGTSRSTRARHHKEARPGSHRQQASSSTHGTTRNVAAPKKTSGSVKSRFHDEFDY